MILVLGTEERKLSFIKLFNEYVKLEKKKKILSSDNRIALSDFVNLAFTGIEPWEKKVKRAEVSKYIRAKTEEYTGKDPVESIPKVRADHLELEDSFQERLDDIFDQRMSNIEEASQYTAQQKELLEEMGKYFGVTEDIVSAIIKELVAMSLGKFHTMGKVEAGVVEGIALLFNKEAAEE